MHFLCLVAKTRFHNQTIVKFPSQSTAAAANSAAASVAEGGLSLVAGRETAFGNGRSASVAGLVYLLEEIAGGQKKVRCPTLSQGPSNGLLN